MPRLRATAIILTPFLATAAHAQSNFSSSSFNSGVSFHSALAADPAASDPFAFSASDLDSIQFTRAGSNGELSSDPNDPTHRIADRQTAFSLSLKPARPKFSLKNGFGLNMIGEAESRLDIESGLLGPHRLVDGIPELHEGLAYSAGLKVEHEDEDIDGTAYVSSGQLGVSFGRLGRLWYGGLDVNLEQFVKEDNGLSQPDVITVDFTTGRRLGWTGTSSASPLWLLSLTGNLDVQDMASDEPRSDKGDWYLNPSLFWQNPEFTFSAQVQVPVEAPSADDDEQPDYRLRAVFEKHFK